MRTWPALCSASTLLLALAACGDSGRETADGSDSAVLTSSATSTLTSPTDPGASETEGVTDSGGTISASGTTGPTSGGTISSSSSASSSSSGTESGSSTGDTGLMLPGCDEEPPEAYMVPPNDMCAVEPAVGMFNPIVEWHKDTWTANPTYRHSVTTPVVVQLTDDDADGMITPADMPDIVFVNYNENEAGALRAISGDGTTELWTVVAPGINRNESVAAADIDNDGIVEILTVTSGKVVLAYEHDGTAKWMSAGLGANAGTYDNAPAVSDMDGDGNPEIVVGRAILDNTGAIVGTGTHGIGAPTGNANGSASMSFAVDLDGDGQGEVVVGNALYNKDGSDIWFNNLADGYPAIADLYTDGDPEIIVISNAMVRAQNSFDGSLVWMTPVPGGLGGPPTVADFDGDGFPEVGVAGRNFYTVFDSDGAVLWSVATQDASSGITGSSVYDFEGDGVADVVYADEINLYVFSGNDGTIKLKFEAHNSGTRIEMPIIADVDGDDQVEIAFVSEPYNGTYTGLTVLGDADNSWRPGRKIWNQHAYHITNVNDDGTVPAVADKNWEVYNNFRSGDLSPPDGLAAPDLQLKAPLECTNTCRGEDQLEIWAQLGNVGAAPLTAGAKIEVYGTMMGMESLLDTVDFVDVLDPGEFAAAIIIPVNTAGLDSLRLVAVPNEAECNVDGNNEIVLEMPFCSIPG